MSSFSVSRVPVDAVGLEARAKSFTKRSIKAASKHQALQWIIGMMDLTTLEGADTESKVRRLCQKARRPSAELAKVPPVAAVCVYPPFVSVACEALRDTPVQVAAVATSFPNGQSFFSLRLEEVRQTVEAGADEIDMVISRGALLSGDEARIVDEVAAVKELCPKQHLKVILETGELETYDRIRQAAQLAIEGGADFVKTSTGKIGLAATLPITLVLLEAVRDHFLATGKLVGVKAAGGIRTAKQAWQYLVMVKETVGDRWLDPSLFRFGASSLLQDVLLQWDRAAAGRYSSSNLIGLD